MNLLTLLLCAISAFANPVKNPKGKINFRPPHEKIEDPGSATPLIYKSPAEVKNLEQKPQESAVKTICTDSMGMMIKKGDSGYEACVRNQDKLGPSRANDKNPNSVGISIGN